MAERKPLFLNAGTGGLDGAFGYHEEMATTDTATFGGLTLEGTVDMNGSEIIGLPAATASPAGQPLVFGQDGAQLGKDFQVTATTSHPTVLNGPTTLQGPVTQGGTTFTDDVSLGGNQITNLNEPVSPGDAANKAYVDAVASGLSVHDHVQAMNDANFDTATGGLPLLDGYQILNNDRILLTGQTDAKQNGIWIAHSGAWLRAADLTTGDHAQGVYTFAQFGGTYGGTGWTCTAVAPNDVVGSYNLPWSQFSSTGHITAGDGIAIDTGVVSVNLATNSGLQFDASVPGKLEALPDTTRALDKDANGLFVKVDGTTVTLTAGGSLQVLGAGAAQAVELTHVQIVGAVAAGDPVYWSAADKVSKALANNDAKSRVIGIAITGGADGDFIDVVVSGAAAVLASATTNTPYYLKATGGIDPAIPGAGCRVIQMGKAQDGGKLWTQVIDYGKKAA
jgi:hypothetical protein